MPNRLQEEPSPYLQQHAQNPVDWYPWSEAALTAAAQQDKPIFLSIGYSACHWCHVMEHESFQDPEIAAFLNRHFISIKVDREERPDLDQIYMMGVMAITGGRGGWPLNAFLMPDQKFFYGGTYWPARSRDGMPGFLDVLKRVQQVFSEQREQATQQAEQMTRHIADRLSGKSADGDGATETELFSDLASKQEKQETANLISLAVNQLIDSCDWQWGGFGDAPKFPHAMDLRLLLQMERRIEQSRRRKKIEEGQYESETLRQAAQVALDRMAAGGIYDHIGGGFARYSVDNQWLVPHFEKMLYDNALLLQAYSDGYARLKDPAYAAVISQTAGYLKRDLRHPAGGFYSSQDADSEGEEGKYYLWTVPQVKELLEGDLGTRFCTAFDITLDGNFEGRNIPNRRKSIGVPVKEMGLSEDDLQQAVEALLTERSKRVPPAIDYKVLTSWNGLAIAALAEAGMATSQPELIELAIEAAHFARNQLRRQDGKLWHAWRDPRETPEREIPPQQTGYLNAYLDDYAAMAVAMFSLYRATWDESWLVWALELGHRMLSDFRAPAGGFFFTSDDHETLTARGKDLQDNSVPSANSLTARSMWLLFRLTGDQVYWDAFRNCVQDGWALAHRSPAAVGHLLTTLDQALGPSREIVLLLPEHADANEWKMILGQLYLPNDLVLVRRMDSLDPELPEMSSHFSNRQCVDQSPTLYVCEQQTCQNPVVGMEAIKKVLNQL